MTRPSDQHLDPGEIEALVSPRATSVASLGQLSEQVLAEAQRHVESCQDCSQKVQMHESVQSEISRMRVVSQKPPGSGCPAETDWINLAAGLLPKAKVNDLMKHAAQCDHCGPALRSAADTVADVATLDEETLLASLSSARPQWQRNMALGLRGDKQVPFRKENDRQSDNCNKDLSRAWKTVLAAHSPAWGVAFAAILIAAVWLVSRKASAPDANELLAKAYTQQRTMVLRIPGAAYGPIRVEEGRAESKVNHTQAFKDANSLIGHQLGAHPNDPALLQTKARADLLEWHYESAIQTLQAALDMQPASTSIMLDLASAYYQRAAETKNSPDYAPALALLSTVLEKDKNNKVALFNHAYVCKELSLYSRAVGDWQRYLQLEPTGDWAQEAQEELLAMRRKLEGKRAESGQLASLLRFTELPDHRESDEDIDVRLEQYQRAWLLKGLPRFIQLSRRSDPYREERRHLAAQITKVSLDRHGDRFLLDFLPRGRDISSKFKDAATTLSAAIQANEIGDEGAALKLATEAARGFASLGNDAGVQRARFEQIYAWQFSLQSRQCEQAAAVLARRSHHRGYRWLEAQALIEQGFCANMSGHLQAAKEALAKASSVADASSLEQTSQRALAGIAAMEWQTGSPARAWDLARQGLRRYWGSPSSDDIRGSSFYSDLDLIAEETEQWFLQEAALQEALSIQDRQNDPLPRAQIRTRLASAEMMLHHDDSAQALLEEANQFFLSAPANASTFRQRALVTVNLAKVELQRGQYAASRQRLLDLQPKIDQIHENLTALDFYATLGEACRRLSLSRQAREASHKAIELFISGLASLNKSRDRLAWYHEASSAYRSLTQLELDDSGAAAALKVWDSYLDFLPGTWKPGVRGAHRHGGEGPPGNRDGRARLEAVAPNEAIFTFVSLPSGVFAWAHSGSLLVAKRLSDSGGDIQRLQARFLRECSNPDSDIFLLRNDGSELYRRLIAPLGVDLRTSDTLVFVSDSALGQPPYSALIDDHGDYLGTQHSIVISTRSLASSKHTPPIVTRDANALVVVASRGNGVDSVPDPLAQAEGEAVASLFHNAVIVGTNPMLKSTFLSHFSRANIFHYAGHSNTTVLGGELTLPLIGTADAFADTPFRAEDVSSRSLRQCQLVVLAACSTAVGEAGRWLDRENLALAFIDQEVPWVVASQWPTDSNSTTTLMKAFYSHLLAGSPVPDSLRLASAVVRADPNTSHPYYWAMFSTFGSA